MTVRFAVADPADLPAVLELLQRAELAEAGLGRHVNALLFTAREGSRLLGCAAVELYGRFALLRSVAVESAARGQGLGSRLTQLALDRARLMGASHVYLLTETAEPFFAARGFTAIDRESVPDPVKRSVEFAGACPASAQAMVLELSEFKSAGGV